VNALHSALPLLNPKFADVAPLPGFRLSAFEIYNWGTFHNRVWKMDLRGENALLTGDIGSGKSTFVDAVTTLLVAPQKIAYNKAAGAEARERSLRSYVLGHYKSERGETGFSPKPVALRDGSAYTVILGRFQAEEIDKYVTLAQIFWIKDPQGQPARLYLIAEQPLSITEHFTGFGPEIGDLRKRLRAFGAELHDSFASYGAAYRRRLGIKDEQAMDLFHQTISMKSVGNLTEFVREHMLQSFDVLPRIDALVAHFDDLNRAHEAVLKAKDQIAHLEPLVTDCNALTAVRSEMETFRACREALRPWFASLKGDLLRKRLSNLQADTERCERQIETLSGERRLLDTKRDSLRQAITVNGGDRLEQIKREIAERQAEMTERRERGDHYDKLTREIGMPTASDGDTFAENRLALECERLSIEQKQSTVQEEISAVGLQMRDLRQQAAELQAELESLRSRRSNIPRHMLDLRAQLCAQIRCDDTQLPFAGELIQVYPEERDWEGAAERVLHNFGLSLLVPEAQYQRVAGWVDRTHLGRRLVYYRVRASSGYERGFDLAPDSLALKLAIKPESAFYPWLESELARRFDYICCQTLDRFRKESRALTQAGQTKGHGERHEKDDRHTIDDRSRYVLGWSNEAKIAALAKQAEDLHARIEAAGSCNADLQARRATLQTRLGIVQQLFVFLHFRELDWRPIAIAIEQLERNRRELEEASDLLRALEGQLSETEAALQTVNVSLVERQQAHASLLDCEAVLHATPEEAQAQYFPELEALRGAAFGEQTLTVESCDNREREMRDYLQARIDTESRKSDRLREKIVAAMQAYRNRFPLEAQELDAGIDAVEGYRSALGNLRSDDLPRFEARFKELLNENAIREIANFQSQLNLERQTTRERIESINRSLRGIDYNPGRYIVLEAAPTSDGETRDFQQDLRACTEGALSGSDEQGYAEAKFLQVRRIIERFRGREGNAELDKRWTRKVTDVRNWQTFSASERRREDDEEYEHYTDSGGKSGGQKEKLAYTVLAASLAYQFGLEQKTGRSFRCVVIDEAFGRGSDESARYGLELFKRLELQLLVVTPLQKIHIIEPFVSSVGFVHNDGRQSKLRNLTIEEYRTERAEHIVRNGTA
jgi:uncharacterized protein YPO0396